jgi:DNA repair protein RecO (recombination protein O)
LAALATPAILLRSIDYGESDRIVTLLGRGTGCLGAIARGARKSQRRFGGGLGLCSVGDAALRERGGSELLTLERFDVTATFLSLGTDVERMGHAAYIAELLAKLCAPRQAEPHIYDVALQFLELLDARGAHTLRLRVFELLLLGRLGFAPALEACASCGRDDLSTSEAIDARFVPDAGGVVCFACASRGRPMRPVVRLALARLARTNLADAETVAAGISADVERGCRAALQELIEGHLSAPLRSLEFLSKLDLDRAGERGARAAADRDKGGTP